jgi:hypothetical protein
MSKKVSIAQRVAQATEDYKNTLVAATEYSGNKEPQARIYSASSLGSDTLQSYLSWKYGRSEKGSFNASTIGSIYQIGCDAICDAATEAEFINSDITKISEVKYVSKHRMKYELPNGWIISGETDQIDIKNEVIFDNKVISGSAYKEIIKNSPDHDYNLQQAVYQFLLEKTKNSRFEAVLAIVNKGGAQIRNDIFTLLHLNTHPSDIIEAALIAETDALQYYIDNDAIPPICDIFKYGKTKDIPNRCALYCSHNHHCPYYSEHKKEKDIFTKLSLV